MVWGRDGTGPFSYGGGEALLDSCLKGPDALALSKALDGLSDRGAGLPAAGADAHGRKLVARGRAVGAHGGGLAGGTGHRRQAGRPISAPSWMRCPSRSGCATRRLALAWGNHAFLDARRRRQIWKRRAREQVALDKTERDLAASARSQNAMLQAKRFAVVAASAAP